MEQRVQSLTRRSGGLTRRGLLQGGAAAAASLVLPWGRGVAEAQTATPVAVAGESAWNDLANRLSGRLLREGDPMYAAATSINATRYAATRPHGIAVCMRPEDTVACVDWARGTGVPFAVRSGGHSYAGFSNSPGLVIDVKAMNSVVVDPANGTVTVAGGANNADVGAGVDQFGVYFPGGRCPSVGVSGLTLGGGWGFSNRHLGMTCDTLISTNLAMANGDLVTASEQESPDLFWAVRGAGGGNFGVHTSFTFRVVPTRDVTVFSAAWSGGDTGGIIAALLAMQLKAPPELGFRLAVTSTSRLPRRAPAPFAVDMIGLHWGSPDEVRDLLAEVTAIQPAESLTIEQKRFPAARAFLAAETPTGTYQIKTGFVQGAMPAEGIATMLEWVAAMPGVTSRAQESTAGFYCWGGKVNDLAPDANAFVHRDADFLFKCEVLWEPQDDPDLIVANLDWIEAFHAAMTPWLSGGAYQNFTDRSQADWARAYYGENLERLVAIKQQADPGNLFTFGQSIPLAL